MLINVKQNNVEKDAATQNNVEKDAATQRISRTQENAFIINVKQNNVEKDAATQRISRTQVRQKRKHV